MKKSFKEDSNPALQFITQQTRLEPQQVQAPRQVLDTKPDMEETKSKRVNLLIYPSLHESMQKIARVRGVSFNDLVNTVLAAYEAANSKDIEKYNEIWGTEQ